MLHSCDVSAFASNRYHRTMFPTFQPSSAPWPPIGTSRVLNVPSFLPPGTTSSLVATLNPNSPFASGIPGFVNLVNLPGSLPSMPTPGTAPNMNMPRSLPSQFSLTKDPTANATLAQRTAPNPPILTFDETLTFGSQARVTSCSVPSSLPFGSFPFSSCGEGASGAPGSEVQTSIFPSFEHLPPQAHLKVQQLFEEERKLFEEERKLFEEERKQRQVCTELEQSDRKSVILHAARDFKRAEALERNMDPNWVLALKPAKDHGFVGCVPVPRGTAEFDSVEQLVASRDDSFALPKLVLERLWKVFVVVCFQGSGLARRV